MEKRMATPEKQRVEIRVPTTTILKLLFTALLVWAGLKIWPELMLLFLSVILAIAFEPVVDWLDRHGLSRGLSVAICALIVLGALTAFAVLVLPQTLAQLQEVIRKLPELQQQIHQELTPKDPKLRKWLDASFDMPSGTEASFKLGNVLDVGQATLTGVMTTAVVFVVTLYLVIDGLRVYAWFLAYVPRKHRAKMAETAHEVCVVIRAYVRGQFVTCALFSLFTLIVLSVFRVPAAIPLALFAGLCDVIPMVGIVIAVAPAAILAIATSKLAALVITAAYLLYHMFENYVIAPRVYGSRLRLSTLTVLLALIVGGQLFGLMGAILILPVVAAYPTIERIWLADYFGKQVIADHGALSRAVDSGDSDAVKSVLRAEKHADERASTGPHPAQP
jgi:predicted PurR-regulated permease PerM